MVHDYESDKSCTLKNIYLLVSGRVINVTSVKGLFSEPVNAAYASTKFAMEAFSDSLRREMHGFGVKVSIIEPCNFGGATDAVNVGETKLSLILLLTRIFV